MNRFDPSKFSIGTISPPSVIAAFEPQRRVNFIASVTAKLDSTDLIAVPITDEWRRQIQPETLAQFMNDNPGCRLGLAGGDVVLYVPDEDIATMARLAL